MQPIRNSAKAIIIQNKYILLTTNKDKDGQFFLLPGGGQQPGETLAEAVKRECREEVGVEVEVGRLWLIREYIGKNHEFAAYDHDVHQIEFMFECTLPPGQSPVEGSEPDIWQTGFAWLPLSKLSDYRIYPSQLKDFLGEDAADFEFKYLGDVN